MRAFVSALNAGAPGDVKADLRVFKHRPRENLVQSYGAEFATALDAGARRRMAGARDERRLARHAPRSRSRNRSPPTSKSLRGVVLHDWTDATLAEQRSAAVRALAKKYTVKVEAKHR